ncbi:MAG: gliding motility protein GldM [Bacteroidia bacterium]|nr:gliding motility protein GldM [Bacteroidia bacterium]
MASGKLSPRQKMINMMYLVLIALLALNISNEILKAFHLMEVSFIKANDALTQKNKAMMDAFQAAADDPAKKVRAIKWTNKAKEVQKISSDFVAAVEVHKKKIEEAAGGRKSLEEGQPKGTLTEMSKGDDMEGHKHYLGTDDPGKRGKGDELKDLIENTRKKMLDVLIGIKDDKAFIATLDKTTAFKVEKDLKDENGAKITWERDVLGHAPVAGVMAMLTKVQNDCKSLETDILTKLAENIDATTAKFDKTAALIIAESTNVMSGSQFRAKIALMAYNSTAASEIMVNGQILSAAQISDGIGEYTATASGVGSHKLEAKIKAINPATGELDWVPAKPIEWTSFQPSATIAADAMNVLYIGLDNPMSISVPGVTPGNTVVSASGINLKKIKDGQYIATVSAGQKEVSISVSAKMPDNTTKKMGEQKFRIKQVPKPVAQLGNLQSGAYLKGQIASQALLYAYMDGFVFDGVKFTVTKYHVIYMPKKGYMEDANVNGNSAKAIQNYAAKAKPGDMIVIEGIRAVGPGGERPLNPITYTIK